MRGLSNRLRTLISYTDIGLGRGVITRCAERTGVKESTFRNWYKNDAYPAPDEMLRVVTVLLKSVDGAHKKAVVSAWIYYGHAGAPNPFGEKKFKELQISKIEAGEIND